MKKDLRFFISFFLLLTIALCTTTCTKEYSYEGGPIADTIPTRPVAEASFTLTGDPLECTQGGVSGDFIAGIPVLVDNYASVTVNITSPGTYYITTDTIDGISFFVNGTFNTIGRQTVSLKPSGTPLVPRNLVFTPHAGNSGCTFTATVVTPGFPATYVLESGFDNSCSGHVVTGSYTASDALSNSNTVSVKVFVTIPGTYAIVTNTKNGMIFSYVGMFTATGFQFVDLVGEGTPAAVGTFTFTPEIVGPHPLGGQACSFDIAVK